VPEPVTLADIKAHLRLDADDVSEDDYLGALITSARVACEQQIGRSVAGKSATIAVDAFPHHDRTVDQSLNTIKLPGGQVSAVTAVSYVDVNGDTVTIDESEFAVDIVNRPGRLAPVTSWPHAGRRPGAVTIEYTIAALDADETTIVAQAIQLIVGSWFRDREATAVDVKGVPAELPLAATWLLQSIWQPATS
jgi:uncharacterized phiE125 gp8 family phage protein